MLRDFVAANRDEILGRARLRVSARKAPGSETELVLGLPKFLEQLRDALLQPSSSTALDHAELKETASAVDHALFVDADHQLLTAAVANLLQNAIKFTRPGSTLSLRAIGTETRVLIEVEDACGGLPPGQAENLLRPYVQAGRDRTGLGLGLLICVKSAKAMGGVLRVRDRPGKGCIFTIDLPKLV